jgi:DNA polymerase-3 subunit delta'
MNIIELHSSLWERLQARRAQLPHSLLLSGPRGLGKFDLARAFAASLLCENPLQNGNACGSCLACNWLSQGNHPDFRLLQPDALAESEGEEGTEVKESGKKASQQITIDQVRGLDDFLHVGTHRHGLRVVIVCPAEAMNRSTANALLKTLEEPAAGTLFLLVSNEPERLLPTIRSRGPGPGSLPLVLTHRNAGCHWLAVLRSWLQNSALPANDC